MARYTPKLNLEEVGISQQDKLLSVQDWRTGLNGTSNSNMTKIDNFASVIDNKVNKEIQDSKDEVLRLDNKIDDKVHLDGKRQQNFNFIENGIEKNGLVESISLVQNNADFCGILNIKNLNPSNINTLFECRDNGSSSTKGFTVFATSDYIALYVYGATGKVGEKKISGINLSQGNTVLLNKSGSVFTFIVNGNQSVINTNLFVEYYSNLRVISLYDISLLYNHPLTPKEIQHNLSILNNSPSIKELHTTDSTGKTSILKLGSDSTHVEMQTGRTLEEEYTSLLSRFGKEIDSPDGRAVQVDNGVNGKVLKMSIKGHTVKNELLEWNSSDWYISSYLSNTVFLEKEKLRINATGSESVNVTTALLTSKINLKPSTRYYITCFVHKNTLPSGFILCNSGSNQVANSVIKIPSGFTGKFTSELVTNPTFTSWSAQCVAKEAGELEISNIIVSELNIPVNTPIPYGLSSTQAIISNNGQQYHIYESTILGKTRILNAQGVEVEPGTTGARLVSLEPTDSSLPKLGSTPDTTDILDRVNNQVILNTIEVNADNFTIAGGIATLENVYRQGISWQNGIYTKGKAISDIFQCASYDSSFQFEGLMTIDNDRYGYVNLKKERFTSVPTSSEFLAKLKELNPTIRFGLKDFTVIQLTEKQLSAYDTYRKVISLPFPEDKVTLNADGSATWVDASNRKMLTIKETWLKSSVQNADANCFQIEVIDADNDQSKIIVFCDKLESVTGASTLNASTLKPNTCGIDGSRYLRIGVPKSVETVEQMKEFAKDFNIIYRSKTQDITYINKSIAPTILTNKTNILSVGDGVNASSFKFNVPIDKFTDLESRMQALESVTVDNILNK